MRNIIITEKELDVIMRMIDDWGFEYSLKCSYDEVSELRESLQAVLNIQEAE